MLTPGQCRAARGLLSWTQRELADAAGIGLSSIVDLERERREVSTEIRIKIRAALDAAGVELIDENGGGEGARLSKPSTHRRKRR